jgi:hypothetical protein
MNVLLDEFVVQLNLLYLFICDYHGILYMLMRLYIVLLRGLSTTFIIRVVVVRERVMISSVMIMNGRH